MCKIPELPPANEDKGSSQPECPGTGSYSFCLDRAAQATAAGDLPVALLWIRQAELIGSTIEKRAKMPEVISAYGHLINDCCLTMRNLTIRSGNITIDHERLTAQVDALCTEVCRLLQSTDQAQAQRAAVLQGLVRTLAVSLERARRVSPGIPVISSVKPVENLLVELKGLQTSLKELGLAPIELFGSALSNLELARIAVSNAEFSLVWIFPSALSEWDKADFMCRQSEELLAIVEGTGEHKAQFESVHADLKRAQSALARHSYREASNALKITGKSLESCLAAYR